MSFEKWTGSTAFISCDSFAACSAFFTASWIWPSAAMGFFDSSFPSASGASLFRQPVERTRAQVPRTTSVRVVFMVTNPPSRETARSWRRNGRPPFRDAANSTD
jgi:hypothetical protein